MIVIDHLTVFIATIVGFVLASLWYSPYILGNVWQKHVAHRKITMRKRVIFLLFNFVCLWVFTYFLAFIEGYLSVTSFWDGVIAGIVVWLGFIVTTFSIHAFWENKSWQGYFIDIAFWFIASMAIGGILAG